MKSLYSIVGSLALVTAVYGGSVADKIRSLTPPDGKQKYGELPMQKLFSHSIFPDITVLILEPPAAVSLFSPNTPPMTMIYFGKRFRVLDCNSDEICNGLDSIIIEKPGAEIQIYDSTSPRGVELFNGAYEIVRSDLSTESQNKVNDKENTKQPNEKKSPGRLPIAYFKFQTLF